MEFNEKLQELRKARGLTQDELAARLFVSRTAVSKWESGRGYPNIESLKAISREFSVTVDELLSSDEVLTLAVADKEKSERGLRELLFGLLDISMALLFFLPFFAEREGEIIREVSLVSLAGVEVYLKVAYFAVVSATVLLGVAALALQSFTLGRFDKMKVWVSLSLGACAVLLFVISGQPYAAVFAFSLLIIKSILLFKRI